MASSIKPVVRTYKVSASNTIKAYSFVKYDSSSNSKNPTIVPCTSGRPIGIAQNSSDASGGDEVEVAFPGGGGLLTLGGTVNLGEAIKATTSGYGIETASAGDYIGAQAEEGGVSGDVIGVTVVFGQKQSSDAN